MLSSDVFDNMRILPELEVILVKHTDIVAHGERVVELVGRGQPGLLVPDGVTIGSPAFQDVDACRGVADDRALQYVSDVLCKVGIVLLYAFK